jgi:hypothetical protein
LGISKEGNLALQAQYPFPIFERQQLSLKNMGERLRFPHESDAGHFLISTKEKSPTCVGGFSTGGNGGNRTPVQEDDES